MTHTPTIAVVTGANRGLGKETCRQLASQGVVVYVTARSLKNAEQVVKELGGENLIAAQLDVADPSSINHLAENVARHHGQIDILINNAAIHYDTWQNALNADLQTVQEAMDTNLYGAWRMVQAFVPLLCKSSAGRIVNVSSGAGALSSMNGSTPAYSMSKIGLNALTLMLANQLRANGIAVNAVCPGWVATDMGGAGGRPVEEGAKGIVWAAMLEDTSNTGNFYRDDKPIDF
ncbi:SDR family NAD(P)-dependent oxidoreductase [Vibrio sp. SCSIO 43136]|uniref:SDR family NAD(P)-dependent oxidoreductase n=1 Tax=Vibrio sp. SCSIO 43136 TaxID=2819101 RepID=UPI002075E623|nr:SDR family NAD(P)-dependent oxidoreductase [Vibrio sp. SCSIO 43136]USD67410.1 SDR family NAD(P)-dependent oxidoreductase [Vibrio sp. SCSIO 43136]